MAGMSAGAAAIIGGGTVVGSLINSYQNLKNSADTNKMNYKIWQEQLAAQRENWKREQDNYLQNRRWQLQDIKDQRNYDSPAAQKQRFLAAGINPYLENSMGSASAVSPPPSAPSFSAPVGAPTMQPATVDFGIGQGISQAMDIYYRDKEEERKDYSLGADITFRDRSTRAELINAATKAKEAGVNSKWVDSQIEDANRNFYFNQDKFSADIEYRNMVHSLDKQRLELENLEVEIKSKAVANDIRLSNAQISQIAQAIKESKQRVDNMMAEQDLSYKEYQKSLKQMMFDMKAELLRIGISNEQLKSQKFKDFFGTIVNSLITGAGVYYGIRGVGAVRGASKAKSYNYAPYKPEPYDPIKDTPWNSW